MADPAEITDLVGEIYDAALDPALWPRVLRRTRAMTTGAVSSLGSDLHYEERPRAREVMQLLAPHFRRAAAIGRALERNESKAVALADVLDRLRCAVVFVDRYGRLLHANEPAARALALNDGLTWIEGKPRPRDTRAAAHLESILAAACGQAQGSDSRALSVTVTAVSSELLTIHVLPLSAGTRRRALAQSAAVAAILVSRGASDIPQRVQSAANLYAFTPAESRVAQALLGGGTVGNLARALGISEATVKTHLQHIFDKTGTRRRADLVQLIAGFGAP